MSRVLLYIVGASFIFLTSILFSTQASAEIIINELSPNPSSGSEWVELYNDSGAPVDLREYKLVDVKGNVVTSSCILNPNGFTVAYRGTWLNKSGDTLYLKKGGEVVDCISYGDGAGEFCPGKSTVDIESLDNDEYGARTTDGLGAWIKGVTHTQDSPNDGSSKPPSAVCVDPTPSPTPLSSTPTPTQSPTNTPISSPTVKTAATSVASTKPTPAVTQRPRSTPDQLASGNQDDLILGLRDQLKPPPEDESQDKKGKKKFPAIAGAFVVGGVLFMGAAGYPIIKTKFFNKKLNEKTIS